MSVGVQEEEEESCLLSGGPHESLNPREEPWESGEVTAGLKQSMAQYSSTVMPLPGK